MFITFGNIIGGAAALASEEFLTVQTLAGRTDGVRLYLDAIGIPCKGVKKGPVIAHLDAIVAGAVDLKGSDSFRVAVPLFAQACADMLGKGDRTRADGFERDYAIKLRTLKAIRAATKKDKVAAATPTTNTTPTPTTSTTPAADAAAAPAADAAAAPATAASAAPATAASAAPAVIDPVDTALALILTHVAANTLTDAQRAVLANIVELLSIPA